MGVLAQAQTPSATPWVSSPEQHSAAISVYHHVAENTPYSTSIAPEQFEAHLRLLDEGGFTVSPLAELIDTTLRNEAIAPLLQRYGFPFSVFLSTAPIDRAQRGYLTWTQLRELVAAGVTIGNHGAEHDSVLAQSDTEIRENIKAAQLRIDAELGPQPKLFAYPYGEFNPQAQQIVSDLGYRALAQNSGAIGPASNALALPRFPLAGPYAGLSGAEQKYSTLAFPLAGEIGVDPTSRSKTRALQIAVSDRNWLKGTLNCFDAGELAQPASDGYVITLNLESPGAQTRRWLTTCTARHEESGRYFWYSQPWTNSSRPL
jgi:peptidoglycan/xylan/chitin deacetylase (PgdA/CDA1 family)